MPLRPRKQRQHTREQQRAQEQDRNTHCRHVPVKLALLVLDKTVEQVDRNDEKGGDNDGDQRAGAEVYAAASEVDFVAGAGFERVFLCET